MNLQYARECGISPVFTKTVATIGSAARAVEAQWTRVYNLAELNKAQLKFRQKTVSAGIEDSGGPPYIYGDRGLNYGTDSVAYSVRKRRRGTCQPRLRTA